MFNVCLVGHVSWASKILQSHRPTLSSECLSARCTQRLHFAKLAPLLQRLAPPYCWDLNGWTTDGNPMDANEQILAADVSTPDVSGSTCCLSTYHAQTSHIRKLWTQRLSPLVCAENSARQWKTVRAEEGNSLGTDPLIFLFCFFSDNSLVITPQRIFVEVVEWHFQQKWTWFQELNPQLRMDKWNCE